MINKRILAIDPGTFQSALVIWNGKVIEDHQLIPNNEVLAYVKKLENIDLFAIEMIASYGMAVGKTVFETCVMIGRLEQIGIDKGFNVMRIVRKEVKIHHCNSNRAKDSNIRAALIDQYGAPGVKAKKGLTYGISKDKWAAFALATYVADVVFHNKFEPVKTELF